jgi:hypothetical protein
MFDGLGQIVQRQKYYNARAYWWTGFGLLNAMYLGHLSFISTPFFDFLAQSRVVIHPNTLLFRNNQV